MDDMFKLRDENKIEISDEALREIMNEPVQPADPKPNVKEVIALLESDEFQQCDSTYVHDEPVQPSDLLSEMMTNKELAEVIRNTIRLHYLNRGLEVTEGQLEDAATRLEGSEDAFENIVDRLSWTPCAKDGCARSGNDANTPSCNSLENCPHVNVDADDIQAAIQWSVWGLGKGDRPEGTV